MADWQTGPRVVIVGGGFGGLYCARALARQPVRITLVDRKNHHTFQPLLYQVATAALSPGDIASPIRSILRHFENVEVLLAEVVGFALEQREVLLADGGRLDYDYLVVAPGAQHSYFGHDDWEPLAPGLKTIEDALEIRRRVLLAYEVAERQAAEGKDPGPLSFVIVGAGPTGVELAGAHRRNRRPHPGQRLPQDSNQALSRAAAGRRATRAAHVSRGSVSQGGGAAPAARRGGAHRRYGDPG